ncbi:hypothetical protein B296_00045337, partial [Ensete ventricosum]
IKTDVETQGDFIRFLIKEVEHAAFTNVEDVVAFVKWLDDELSFLVDERAVLKHFEWPEHKADAMREAAFGYCDLKKLIKLASVKLAMKYMKRVSTELENNIAGSPEEEELMLQGGFDVETMRAFQELKDKAHGLRLQSSHHHHHHHHHQHKLYTSSR